MRVVVCFHPAEATQCIDDAGVVDLRACVASKAAFHFASLPDSTRELSVQQLRSQLQQVVANKNVQLADSLDKASLVCVRPGADDTSQLLYSVSADADVRSLQANDQLHAFFPAPGSVAFAIAVGLLSTLSSTATARPPSPQTQRLAEWDRVGSVECTVPRTDAERVFSTTEIAALFEDGGNDAEARRQLAAALVQSFRQRGFARLRFSAEELAALAAMHASQRAFFAQSVEEKDPSGESRLHTSDYQRAFGYSSSHACRKEFFVVRQAPLNPAPHAKPDAWRMPTTPADLEPSTMRVFHRLGAVCQQLLRLVLEELGAAPERIEALLKDSMAPGRDAEANRFTSVIELFRYSVGGGESTNAASAAASSAAASSADVAGSSAPPPPLPCSIHSDASIFTLIPRCVGPPGLQLYSWGGGVTADIGDGDGGGWQAVEAQSRADEAVVFPGDMLQRITDGAVLATPHRVAFVAQPQPTLEQSASSADAAADSSNRYSAPFELFLAPDTVVDCASLLGRQDVSPDCRPVVSAMEALSALSRNLVSVNKTN